MCCASSLEAPPECFSSLGAAKMALNTFVWTTELSLLSLDCILGNNRFSLGKYCLSHEISVLSIFSTFLK